VATATRVSVDPSGPPLTLRLQSTNANEQLAAVVWRYGPGREPLGPVGELRSGNLQLELGNGADASDDYFLTQGELLPNGEKRTYSLVISVTQGDRELVTVAPEIGGSGQVDATSVHFQQAFQCVPDGLQRPAAGGPAVVGLMPRLRTVVWMHGMGDSEVGFSKNLIATLTESASGVPDVTAIQHREIVYEPLNQDIAKKFRQIDLNVGSLLGQAGGWIADKVKVGENVNLGNFEAATRNAIGDVGGMVLSVGARRLVLSHAVNELLHVVADAQASTDPRGHTIDIVCHSLGTFVTYELLHYIAATDAGRGLRPASGVRIRNVFMLAPVLALIRDSTVFNLSQSSSDMVTKNRPFVVPRVPDPWGGPTDVGERFHAFRHKWDPFASIRITDDTELLAVPPTVFDAWHSGPNMHAYSNYMTQFHAAILDEIMSS
jgi:hypothetical protein